MSRIVKTSESLIVEAKRKAEICVLFYPPYYATELERPEAGASGLVFNASSIRRPAYFDGLLRVLQVLNIDYDMADLANAPVKEFMHYRQVWAFSTDEMNAADQQKLVDYVNAGGNLVIYPHLPDREMSQKPCTLLRDSISPDRDSISVVSSQTETIDSPLIDLFNLQDIKCANPQVIYDEAMLGGAEIIARTIKGSACGFSKQVGKGTVIHLGTWLGFDTEGHKPAYEALLARSGSTLRQATVSHENLAVRERFTDDGSGMLFIANYYNEEFSGNVKYKHPRTGDSISIPYDGSTMVWPALYGVLSPLCLKLAEGLSILHCTSDILDISKEDHCIKMTLYCDRDLRGEIVFEGSNVDSIKSVIIDDIECKIVRDRNRVVTSFKHQHKIEIILTIKLH
jgi:beta-galactosidase